MTNPYTTFDNSSQEYFSSANDFDIFDTLPVATVHQLN